jgi:hypothetical protein
VVSNSSGRDGSKPERLSRAQLTDQLILERPATRRLVHALRRSVLGAVPSASEAVKFRVLCYFHGDAYFKSASPRGAALIKRAALLEPLE